MTLPGQPRSVRIANVDQSNLAAWMSDRGSIEVISVRHPILEAIGHHPTSDYAEQFWLPVVGPSALWAHRRLTAGFLGHQ